MISRVKSIFSRIKINQIRNILAPCWRKLIVISVSLLGLAIFIGAEYGLANLIIDDRYLLGVGALVGIAILVISIAYPFWGFAIWFMLTRYLALFNRTLPAMFSFDLIMLSLLTFILITRALFKKESLGKLSLAEVFLILFFIYGYIIRKEFDTNHMVAELKLLFLSPLFFYFIVKNVIREKKHVYWLIVIIVITGVSFAFMGFYEQVTGKMWLAGLMGGNRGLYGGMRSTGPAGHYYVYGNMMIITILLCLHIFKWQQRWYSRLTAVACTGIGTLGLYFGFSRAPYGAFILSIIIMLFLTKYTRRSYAVFVALFVIAAMVLVPILTTESGIHKRFEGGISKDTGRVATDKTSINMFRANYLFGVGKDKYQRYVPDYVSSMSHSFMKSYPTGLILYWGKPHSEYYLVLTELGITGFFLCFMTYFLFLYKFTTLRARLAQDDVVGSDFAVIAIAFTMGVFLTMITDEYSYDPYMYAILFTIYAMLIKSEHFALKEKAYSNLEGY